MTSDALPRRAVFTGGARSGKSAIAERLLAQQADMLGAQADAKVVYLATGPIPTGGGEDCDVEWRRRVDAHRRRRPAHWRTVESQNVASWLGDHPGPVLWDDVGTWVTSQLTLTGAWDDRPGWQESFRCASDEVVDAWLASTAPRVVVSIEVGMGVVPEHASGRVFRDVVGALNARLVEGSDYSAVAIAGRVVPLQPSPW